MNIAKNLSLLSVVWQRFITISYLMYFSLQVTIARSARILLRVQGEPTTVRKEEKV